MTRRFAEYTKVPVEQSRAEIERTLERNYSQLVRDHFIERMEEQTDSLGRSLELLGMILWGKSGDGRK